MKKLLNTLYVTIPETYLSLDGENVVVLKEKQELGRIPMHNIERIIFCYSNGKIPNGDILEQKEHLLSLGIKLELISVYDMALGIEDKYPELALKYLEMNLYNSLNILSVDEFINDSNNGLSPSLDKIFSSRGNEIKELIDAFSNKHIASTI